MFTFLQIPDALSISKSNSEMPQPSESLGSPIERLLKKRGLDRKTARRDASPYQNTRVFEGKAKPLAEPEAFFNSYLRHDTS